MTTLTSFLAALKVENVPEHADFCSRVSPTGLATKCKPACGGCPVGGTTAGHKSYWRGEMTQTLADSKRIRLSTLRTLQWLVHRLNLDANGLIGSAYGWLVGGTASYNYADSCSWTLLSVDGVNNDELTLQAPVSVDPRALTIYTFRTLEPEYGMSYLAGGGGWGVVQPGDIVEFLAPSVLEEKRKPSVVRVLSCTPVTRTIVVQVDQNVSEAMESGDIDDPSPASWSVKTWRAAGDPEKWLEIVSPTWFKGRKKGVEVLTSDLPTNQQYRLTDYDGNDAPIATPIAAAGISGATFIVKGLGVGSAVWSDITDSVTEHRLFVTPTSAVICFGSNDVNGDPIAGVPLADLYTKFKIRYFTRATAAEIAAGKYKYPCYARCRHSKRDHSGSVGNYGAPNGTAIDGEGVHWFCAMRQWASSSYEDLDEDGVDETIAYTWHQPTMIEDYPEDGQCLGWGTCDKWEPMETADVDEGHGFTISYTFAKWLKEIWAASDTKMVQMMSGVASYMNISLSRIRHPSLRWLVGGYPLETPGGLHPQTWFLGRQKYGASTVVEDSGDATLLWSQGAAWDTSMELSDVAYKTPGHIPDDGHFPANVTGWQAQHDQLDYDASLGATYDPDSDQRNHEERCGWRNTRDSGEIEGRGFHRWTHALHSHEDRICERVRLDVYDQWQDRGDTAFKRLTVPLSRMGSEWVAALLVRPIRHSDKAEESTVTRTIQAVSSLGGGVFQIDLENEPHFWSYTDVVGGSPVKIVNGWHGGGGPGFYGPDYTQVDSYDETGKSLGHPGAGVMRGDTCSMDVNLDLELVDLNDFRFLVLDAIPFGGSTADTWGDAIIRRAGTLAGYWQPAVANMHLYQDSVYGDPDDSYWVSGSIYAPSLELAANISPSDTSIVITEQYSIKSGVILKQTSRSGELMRVTGAVYNLDGTMTLNVDRGICSTTADDTGAGEMLEWQLVTQHAGTPDLPLTRLSAVARPAAIATGEYWVEPQTNRILFSASDAGDAVDVRYSCAGQTPIDSSHSYESLSQTIATYAEWNTGLDWDLATPTPTVVDAVSGAALTYTAGNPTAANQWTAVNSSGSILVRCFLLDAGRLLRITQTTEDEADAPGDVALCYNYDQFGKKRDRLKVIDESGALTAAGGSLTGAEITFYRSAGVWMPPEAIGLTGQKVYAGQYGVDAWTEVSGCLLEHGAGLAWISAAALSAIEAAFGTEVCFKL